MIHFLKLQWLVPLVCHHHQNATLSQRQAVAVSQTLSALTAMENSWPSFDSLQFIITLQ